MERKTLTRVCFDTNDIESSVEFLFGKPALKREMKELNPKAVKCVTETARLINDGYLSNAIILDNHGIYAKICKTEEGWVKIVREDAQEVI